MRATHRDEDLEKELLAGMLYVFGIDLVLSLAIDRDMFIYSLRLQLEKVCIVCIGGVLQTNLGLLDSSKA